VKVSTFGFRANSEVTETTAYFVLQRGGLGDYINMSASLLYIAENFPHVKGRVIVNPPFLAVMKYLLRDFTSWYCIDGRDKNLKLEDGSLIVAPDPKTQSINATGAHLLDLGYHFFLNVERAPSPEHDYLPRIDYAGPWKWKSLDRSSPYAVFTPGATTDSRTMPAKPFNELVDYALSLGVTPVFLGKKNFAATEHLEGVKDYSARFDKNYDLSKGVDLREQTTLLESVQIMRGAKFVLGLDNGLLHFAGTTSVPIIFGHNIADVKHREIRRPNPNYTFNIQVPREALGCIGCQSNMRYAVGHRFNRCAYGDLKCLDLLFYDDSATWKLAIDEAMKCQTSST